ncbi:MAG: hypothetical protein JOY78_00190, partial [Pseudonocardia sp.]|nr:hypothetical protein [Pseudonocardia sp.]
MPYRGYFALNGVEIANSSRAIAHLGTQTPPTDYGLWTSTSPTDCGLVESETPGLWVIPTSSSAVSTGLYTPPNGARRVGPGLFADGACWGPPAICASCRTHVNYDDSWEGLRAFLSDDDYRPELAPWYTTEQPESGEFGGVWVMKVTGLDSTPVERLITQTVGDGAVAGPHRDMSRTVTFEALILACTNAGAEFGLNWLTCLLRSTTDNIDTVLRYLRASPQDSGADPATLVREAHGVVLTKAPEIADRIVTTSGNHQHGNMYRITWEMTVLSPYAYLPADTFDVVWGRVTRQPINWIHAADCAKPETCLNMPVLFSTDCVPEEIPVLKTPPPVCGGCLPVSAIDKYSFRVPMDDQPFHCRQTAVSMVFTNTGEDPLTLQAFFRVCGTDVRCEDNQWPLQIAGLPPGAALYLDGITGRYKAFYDERWHRPVGIVGTPNG